MPYFVIIIIAIIVSCNSEPHNLNEDDYEDKVDVVEVDLSDYTDAKTSGVHFYSLNDFIGNISRMKIDEQYIALRSDEGTRLYLFDTESDDIKVSIDHYGQGPDEYESIIDFDILDARYVKIMDRLNASINYYAIESGDFVRSEQLPFSADRFVHYKENRFLFYQNSMTATLNDKEYQYKFIITDEKFNIIERSISWDMESEHHQPGVHLDLGNMLYPSHDKVIYSQWDNDSLYTVSGDSVYFSKIYDFGSQNRKHPEEPFFDLSEMLNYYIFENEDFVGMSQGIVNNVNYKLSNFYYDGSIYALKEHKVEGQQKVIRYSTVAVDI